MSRIDSTEFGSMLAGEFKALLIDDSDVFRQSFRELLLASFPEMFISEASSGADAWKRLKAGAPRLVFTDIKIGTESGLSLVYDIRQSYPHIALAILTGHDEPEYRQAAFDRGADYFIPKEAVTTADIAALIDSIDSGKRPQWGLGEAYINPALAARPSR